MIPQFISVSIRLNYWQKMRKKKVTFLWAQAVQIKSLKLDKISTSGDPLACMKKFAQIKNMNRILFYVVLHSSNN